MPELTMPRLSDSMEEGTILRWLVEDGTEVAKGDEIVEIETDKAAMVFEADVAGTLWIGAVEGDTLAVGAAIAKVVAADEIAAPPPDAERTAPEPVTVAAPEAVAAAAAPAPRSTVADRPRGAASSRIKASPVARRVADALGIDLAALTGSGPQGRVGKRDVEAAAAAAEAPEGTGAPPPLAPVPAVAPARAPAQAPVSIAAVPPPAAAPSSARGEAAIVELSRVQATIARRMAEAKATQPDFTLTVDVDMDAAVEMRSRFKELGDTVVPSYNDLVVRASALALRKHPRANGAFRDGRYELYPRVNVGVAVAAADALLVPTVVDADRLSLGAIAAETRRLAAGARAGTLAAPDLSGGTFSVSNLGMFGIERFSAVLNPPQAAILAVGALERRPVVRGDAVVPGHRMSLTLTCDHRILYGADAAAFLAEIRAGLERPLRLAL